MDYRGDEAEDEDEGAGQETFGSTSPLYTPKTWWQKLHCTKSQAWFGGVGIVLIVLFAIILGARRQTKGLEEFNCPENERVYYPLRDRWSAYTFMFCCPCCAMNSEPLCYDDMLKWLTIWYDDTLTLPQQKSVSYYLYSTMVVRGLQPKMAPPLAHALVRWLDFAQELVPPHKVLELMVNVHDLVNTSDPRDYKRVKHVLIEDHHLDDEFSPDGTRRHVNKTHYNIKNLNAPEEFAHILTATGHGEDSAMFRMAFVKSVRQAVYKDLHHRSLDLVGMASAISYMPFVIKTLIEDHEISKKTDEEKDMEYASFGEWSEYMHSLHFSEYPRCIPYQHVCGPEINSTLRDHFGAVKTLNITLSRGIKTGNKGRNNLNSTIISLNSTLASLNSTLTNSTLIVKDLASYAEALNATHHVDLERLAGEIQGLNATHHVDLERLAGEIQGLNATVQGLNATHHADIQSVNATHHADIQSVIQSVQSVNTTLATIKDDSKTTFAAITDLNALNTTLLGHIQDFKTLNSSYYEHCTNGTDCHRD